MTDIVAKTIRGCLGMSFSLLKTDRAGPAFTAGDFRRP